MSSNRIVQPGAAAFDAFQAGQRCVTYVVCMNIPFALLEFVTLLVLIG